MTPKAMAPKALVLDCDGVLADTELDGHLVAFNQAFDQLGHGFQWSKDEYAALLAVGGGKERFRKYLSENPQAAETFGDRVDDAVLETHKVKSDLYVDLVRQGKLPARPGIRRLIEEALDAGWEVAVASTSAPGSVQAVVDSVFGDATAKRLTGIFAGDMVEKKKPAPDIYLMAAHELGSDASSTVVIEDSAVGAAAADAAGFAHIVTTSTFTVGEEFPGAAVVLSDLGEPGAPATVREGEDVRNADGYVDVASLEHILAERG